MDVLLPVRSLLFAPANRPELIRKFLRYRADVFVIDLEDGTPEDAKESARRELPATVSYLREHNLNGRLFVRTNEPRSAHFNADLDAVCSTTADGIMAPKLEMIADIGRISSSLPISFGIIGLVETATGVANVERLAGQGNPHLCAIAFGAEDFITNVGGRRTAEGLEVLYARSRVLIAAKAAGLAAIDQVFVNIRDDDGFRRDAELARQLGYDGKMCLTPRQAEIANEVFSPSKEEIERSRRLIQAYESAQAAGRGVIVFEGGMVDEPLLKRARAILNNSQGED